MLLDRAAVRVCFVDCHLGRLVEAWPKAFCSWDWLQALLCEVVGWFVYILAECGCD